MTNIVVLVSGGGTNLGALIKLQDSGELRNGKIMRVISSKDGVYALKRAEAAGIPHEIIAKADYPERDAYTAAIVRRLDELDAGLIVMAGFMHILGHELNSRYRNRVINVHPSLIPAFCGDGFYGTRVHKAVLDYGVRLTGATVHFVNDDTDGGPVILQKAVPVLQDDTPESLQKRVMEEAEWDILPKAVSLFCEGRLEVFGRKVKVMEE